MRTARRKFNEPGRCVRVEMVALLVLFAAPGCGRSTIAPASGHVTSSDVQVAGGTVMFLPIGGGKPALGAIDDEGSFELTTYRPGDGALIGEHRVTVLAKGPPGSQQENDRQVCRPPADYRVTVAAGQANSFQFVVDPNAGWQIISDD